MDDLEGLLKEIENVNKPDFSLKKDMNNRLSRWQAQHLNDDSSESSDGGELKDLDNLLEDLYLARKQLATSHFLDTSRENLLKCHQNDQNVSVSVSLSPHTSSSNSPSSATTNDSTESNKLQASKELEQLMASISSYKVPQTTQKQSSSVLKNVCRYCQSYINGKVITAMGSMWHPEHFLCFKCGKCIGTQIFYEKDDQPYCEADYLELFSPKCARCNLPILDKMLTALDNSWHLNCFKCKSCKKQLHNESFLEINSSAYCKDCYQTELAPRCKFCSKAIIDNFISALDGYFHPNCFVCYECGVPFNTTSFYEYDNLPYCEIHYHLKRGSLCHGCSKPINGRCVTAMSKKYHPEHFSCTFCLKQLSNGTFKEQNEKPYCNDCFVKIFPK